MFRTAFLSSILIGSAVLAAASPQIASAKCPDEPDAICADLRFEFPAGEQLVAGRDIPVTAHWFNDRTAKPVVNEEWLAQRESPVYLWGWDHEPVPDEWQTRNVQTGASPRPTVWAVLAWDGRHYRGTVNAQEAGLWYFRIGTSAPVPAMESDQGVGYSGPRFAINVLAAPSTPQPFPWVWAGAAIALVLLAASRRKSRVRLTRQHPVPIE